MGESKGVSLVRTYRIFLDFGMWHNGLPQEIKEDSRIEFLGDMLVYLWMQSINDITFIGKPEWMVHSVPIMRAIHKELMARINDIIQGSSEKYVIQDEIITAIDELEAGGEALFWNKSQTTAA